MTVDKLTSNEKCLKLTPRLRVQTNTAKGLRLVGRPSVLRGVQAGHWHTAKTAAGRFLWLRWTTTERPVPRVHRGHAASGSGSSPRRRPAPWTALRDGERHQVQPACPTAPPLPTLTRRQSRLIERGESCRACCLACLWTPPHMMHLLAPENGGLITGWGAALIVATPPASDALSGLPQVQPWRVMTTVRRSTSSTFRV